MVLPLKGSTKIVWDALCKNGDKPLSAYGLLSLVRDQGIRHAPTIYRALHKLEEMGWVYRIVSLNAYIVCNPPQRGITAVMICNQCHQVSLVRDGSLDALFRQISHEHAFQHEGQVVEMSGVCRNCQDQQPLPPSHGDEGHLPVHAPSS